MATLAIVAGLVGTAPVAGAQFDEDRRLAKMAAKAESAEQHQRVAREYRDRADLLESRAARLERTARRLERGWYPHEHKAAPAQRAGYAERQDAARARSEARDARRIADRHGQIATDLRNAP